MPDQAQINLKTSHSLSVFTVMETIIEEWARPIFISKRNLNEERNWVNHVGTLKCYGNTLCVDEQLIRSYFLHQEKELSKHKQKLQEHIPLSG